MDSTMVLFNQWSFFQKDKNWSVMKCLLAKLNGNGGGALLWAALNENSEGVKKLLEAGVDVNSKCDIFPLFYCLFCYISQQAKTKCK